MDISVADPHYFNADLDPTFQFDPDPDPDPTFHSDADQDSAFQNDADPCGSGSATLMDILYDLD
jgi:hypothetical protein